MSHRPKTAAHLLCGAAVVALCAWSAAAHAEEQRAFSIQPQPLSTALMEFGAQSGAAVMAPMGLMDAKVTRGVSQSAEPSEALAQLLEGTGLTFRKTGASFAIIQAGEGGSGPQSASAGGDVDALIVTAQKREENIQDVPIAISAFSQEDLTRSQVAGGPDLMTQVPNMTFTKTNFSSYSIQLRGIGTQAISATTDAAVAVAFNNTPFIRNHFFEQEFYDLQRVEVLRGPQGTLYGRNATAGVVNVISAKPKFTYEAKVAGDAANYNSTRLEGMVNIPLVEDKAALRLAGAWTKRDGYVTNEFNGNPIDGRDLWSTRASLRFAPTDTVDVNLIWEHFEENDDRLRSGKQLCKTHEVTEISGRSYDGAPFSFETTHYQTLPEVGQSLLFSGVQGSFSQGCAPSSLYSPDSFETPNGISLPYYLPLGAVFLPTALDDPYVSRHQSRDLRVIESTLDPEYRAKADLGQLQISVDLTDSLTLTSETSYSASSLFSLQDYNRFTTAAGAWKQPSPPPVWYERAGVLLEGPNGGIFCDPQLGCSDRLVAVDVSRAESRQFSQEFRLGSNFDGPFNFSLGVNWLRYDNEDKYYVFINSLSLIAAISPYGSQIMATPYVGGVSENRECLKGGPLYPNPAYMQEVTYCTYIDPNPIGALNDLGHNYFLSKNPYKLISYAAFGEVYYNITDNLKLTGGLRMTVDRKEAPRIPSWVLASKSVGYPVTEVVNQEWREPTGRLTLDWKPDLGFTDETLIYASFAHGYKAGGANPPPTGPATYCGYCSYELADLTVAASSTHPKTFEPEFINAFELGAKNTFLDGRLTVNTAAFYYDYEGYQISQIVNRSAVNLNFDAEVWGLEIEAGWRPLDNLRLGFKGGYEKTRVADGEKAIDLMDRTAGNDDWIVIKPFPTFPSNCILPKWLFFGDAGGAAQLVNVGGKGGGNPGGCELAYVMGLDPVTHKSYEPYPDPDPTVIGQSLLYYDNYPGFDPKTAPNNGEGWDKDLSGNELPNAPTFTATLSADYTLPLGADWLMTLHTDLYYQSEAWTRIFNMEGYDKLKAYTNVNLAAIFTNEEAGWNVMAYVKNAFDRDSITGAFLNSDDTGLTTNVFLTEPRTFGLRVTKNWTGGGLLGSFGQRWDGPYPFTLEVGGQVQRHDAPNQAYAPGFLDAFSPVIDPRGYQDVDLDWGDGRDVKLTYAPGEAWKASVDIRFGKTNRAGRLYETESLPKACFYAQSFCDAYAPLRDNPKYYLNPKNWSETFLYEQEKHTVVDFMVGRDVGFGALGAGKSTLSAGLRYAKLESLTSVDMTGIPDWQIAPEYVGFSLAQNHRYRSETVTEREFRGAGPVLAWEASQRLLGNSNTGEINADWSLSGGVLFGKQKTAIQGSEREAYYNQMYAGAYNNPPTPYEPPVVTGVDLRRSRSVTVPVAALSLGLSYKIDRMKVGAGYRWERYFDAIDGGMNGGKSYDRTIDGPYFKIAVGFGG